MHLSPGAIVVLAVVAIAIFLVARWGRRHEAAAPSEQQAPTPVSRATVARDERAVAPLVQWLLERAREQTGTALDGDPLARQRITEAATKAMEELRTDGSAEISLPYLTADASGPKHFGIRFTRRPDSSFMQEG